MRYLLVSDLHANWDALEAVLAGAEGQYDAVLSCGDLVGYGPDPNRVIDWARANLRAVIRGNHDRACCGLEDLEWFNPVAKAATLWTMEHLSEENLIWLRSLPQGPVTFDGFQIAHGSPLDEDEYISSMNDASNLSAYLESPITFIGHTHLQGGFVWADGRQERLARPDPPGAGLDLRLDPDAFYLINPGSVGQPRDGDSRAAWAVYDTGRKIISFRRTAYSCEAVSEKIQAAGLPPILGARLVHGR